MAFQKGRSGNPAGRPRGSQNKTTAILRETIALIVEKNACKMDAWLDRIAEDDPRAAFQLMIGLMDFSLPKYARTAWIEAEDIASQDLHERKPDKYLQLALEAVERVRQTSDGGV